MAQTAKNSAKPERLTVTLGGGQRRKIGWMAKQRRTSVATVIRWALDDFIEANEGKMRSRLKPKRAP